MDQVISYTSLVIVLMLVLWWITKDGKSPYIMEKEAATTASFLFS